MNGTAARLQNSGERRESKLGYTGINLGNVKISNRSAILKLLNDQGAMSRKDIASTLGLTPASVTLISTELLSAGILCEKGELEEEKRAGRKKVLIDINYKYKYVLSISIEASETCIAISDLRGRSCALRKLKTDDTAEPAVFLKVIADEGKALMWESGIAKEQLLGAGVSIPGPVKRAIGVSQHAYRIWNEVVPVGELLKSYLDVPVIVENNVKAFAEGELIYGNGKEQENLVFLKWGPGVGSAIIIQNHLYDSQNSKTAEIGHCIVEPHGKLCRCGRHGCLETRVGLRVITKEVREACTEASMPQLWDMVEGDVSRIDTRNISWWLESRDEKMWEIMDRIIELLARTVVNTLTLLAPDKLIIYGQMFDIPALEERFRDCVKSYDATYQEEYILKSKLSDRIGYIGPLAIVANELFLMVGNADE